MSEEVKLIPLDVIHADEPVMEIRLSNGYTMRARLIVTAVYEHAGKRDDLGNPMMQCTWQVAMGIVPTRKVSN
jgi:hypothetical protein